MKYFTNADSRKIPDVYQKMLDEGKLTIQPPKATSRYSVEELEKLHMIGLYLTGETE